MRENALGCPFDNAIILTRIEVNGFEQRESGYFFKLQSQLEANIDTYSRQGVIVIKDQPPHRGER